MNSEWITWEDMIRQNLAAFDASGRKIPRVLGCRETENGIEVRSLMHAYADEDWRSNPCTAPLRPAVQRSSDGGCMSTVDVSYKLNGGYIGDKGKVE